MRDRPWVQQVKNYPESKAGLLRLRRMTGAGYMDCLRALQAAGGDVEAACEMIVTEKA